MAEKLPGKGKGSRAKKKKKRSSEALKAPPQPLPNIPFEDDFPALETQTPHSSRGANFQGQNVLSSAAPVRATHQQPSLQAEPGRRLPLLGLPVLEEVRPHFMPPPNHAQICSPSVPQVGSPKVCPTQGSSAQVIPQTNSPQVCLAQVNSRLPQAPLLHVSNPQINQLPIGSQQVRPPPVIRQVHPPPVSRQRMYSPSVNSSQVSQPPIGSQQVNPQPVVSPQVCPPPVSHQQMFSPPVSSPQVSHLLIGSQQVNPQPVVSPQVHPPPVSHQQMFSPPVSSPQVSHLLIGSQQVNPQPVVSPQVHPPPVSHQRMYSPPVSSPQVSQLPIVPIGGQQVIPPPAVSPQVCPPPVSHQRMFSPPVSSPQVSQLPIGSQQVNPPPAVSPQVCPPPVSRQRWYSPPANSPQVLPQVTPLNSQLIAHPNSDTPDEAVAPAHPSFHPKMNPASSNLSTHLTFTDVRGRPDQPKAAVKKIDARLNAIIDDLASTGKFVPENVVKNFKDQLLKQCYRAGCSVNPRDIKAFDAYSKIHGRIAQLIQIFCWMSPITTLYELERALMSSENVASFQELRIGPLIKHPYVAKYFQPPQCLQEIPEITAHQIQKTLMKFLDKTKKAASRGERHFVGDFLEFFAKSMSKSSPLDLCVRITSFPLAIQTNYRFRRMQRESRDRVQQKIDEEVQTIVSHEMDQVRRKLTLLCDPRNSMVTSKDPIALLADIFGLFLNYLSGMHNAKVNAFLQLLLKQQQIKQMFLLAIYVGAYGIESRAGEVREENSEVLHGYPPMPQQVVFHRTHGEVLDVLLQLLRRQPFPISLPDLASIEKAVAEHFDVLSFHLLTNTSFLDLVISDRQCTSSLGGSLTIGAVSTDKSKKRKIVDIVSQLRPTERNNKEVVSETLKVQYGVPTMDQIHCGSIEKLISDVTVRDRAEVNTASHHCVTYLAPLLMNGVNDGDTTMKEWSCTRVGVLGHKSATDAVACLQCAPLLEDLAGWSHWDLVFKPQHGELGEFIEREGPKNGLHALEVLPGTLLRVDPEASHQKFLEAIEANDPINTAGQLVSIVIQQGSVHEVSMQLLGNHVQTALDRLMCDSSHSDECSGDQTILARQFIYHCLIRIPHKISYFLSKEVFLEPLRRVSSTTAVENLLCQCKGVEGEGVGRRYLQSLGMGLGIKAWNDDFTAMLDEANRSQILPITKLSTSAHTTVKPNDREMPTTTPDQGIYPGIHNTTSPPTNVDLTTSSEDRVDDQTMNIPIPVTAAIDPEKEAYCRSVVENIRSEEFGVGLQLDGRQKEVAEKQRQREGRGLQRLSKELYSKDTHFVLELIQNADDNSYHESLLSESVPALKFIIGSSSVSVLNNEVGFSEKNIRAICDVGRSTKGAHQSGYIGQKGIGFKSVFRVTDKPEIHSGGYHIKFDAHCDAIGYILPHWIEEEHRESAAVGKGWNTTIVLPLKEDQLSMSLVRKFQDVRPSLLLFLHRLRSITVEHQASGVTRYMNRSDGCEGIIQIEHNTDPNKVDRDTWLVVRNQLTNVSQFKAEVEVTEVALAFPLGADIKAVTLAKDMQQQQVFAFLPLRSYGFRFIVQGDFDLPSSREDVNSDSVWNQFIRDEIPQLFLTALDKIKKLPSLSHTDAVALYLQFIPLDGELHDFFKPVAIRIRNLLRGTACLPTEPGSDDITEPFCIVKDLSHAEPDETSALPHLWKQPSELVVVRDSYIQKHIPQSLLNSVLHYFYLSSNLARFMSPPLQSHLGVQSLSIDHLIAVAEAVMKSYNRALHSLPKDDAGPEYLMSDSDESDSGDLQAQKRSAQHIPLHSVFVQWVAQWLACVHIILEEDGDRSPITIGKLKKTQIIPLMNGAIFAAQDGSLFFPSDGDSAFFADFKGLFDEIKVVDLHLFEAQGDCDANLMVKPSHRVHSVLELLGVKEMYPAEVIKHHILPSFKDEQWKTKSAALLTTYLVYIKDSLGKQGSGVNEAEVVSLLQESVALVTKNHGRLQPSKDVLHFPSEFKPSYDLEKLFPGVKWKLVSPRYLKNVTSKNAVSSWQGFLMKLGVQNVIAVRQFSDRVPKGTDRWQELREFVGRSSDGAYTLRDYTCSEFEDIVKSVKSETQNGPQQMKELVHLFDKLWDEKYWQFAFARCYDGSNENYIGGDKTVPSSFHRALKEHAWLPAVSFPSGKMYDQLYRGCELFDSSKAIQRLLDCHVPYIAVELKNPKLLNLLQIKCRVSAHELIGFLREWSQASTTPGEHFRASIAHMSEVYIYLSSQMVPGSMEGDNIREEFLSGAHNLIFVPDVHDTNTSSADHVNGRFYSIHSLCWVDPSSVLYKHQQYNRDLPNELPKVLQLHYESSDEQTYQNIKVAFQNFGVRESPTAAAYINTLKFISSLAAIPEKHHISDFASVALHLSQVCMKGDITPQYLQPQLKGVKVFPSHRDLWISLDNCLLEKDDMQLAKVFSECKDVHFLQWPASFQKKRMRYEDQQRDDERKYFINVCGIAKLSEVVETIVVPSSGMVMPLESLRRRLHFMVPLIQRYLLVNEKDLYQSLVQENFQEKLAKMFIGSVLGLECLYSIHHRGITYHSPSKSSPGSEFKDSTEDDTAALYVVASKVDSPKCLVPTLKKIFTGKQVNFADSNRFESLIKDMLLVPIEEIDSVLSDYSFGEVDECDVWEVPFHEEPERVTSEVEEESEDMTVTTIESMEPAERDKSSDGLKSWPPMAPVSTSGSTKYPAKPPPPGSAVADVVGEDDIQKISEKYAMSKNPAARPVSRVDGQLQHKPPRDNESKEYATDDTSPTTSHKPKIGAKEKDSDRHQGESGNRTAGRDQQPRDGGREQQHEHNARTRDSADDNTTHHPPTERGRGAAKKDHKWHESMKPDEALNLSSFSIAAALQSIPVDSCDLSFLDDCDQDSRERVGRWGEEYVYKYLNAVKLLPNGKSIQSVTWINETSETGKPYDIEVTVDPDTVLYIEVKSTKSPVKELMQFSWNELQFANREKQNYHLYRVYSAGSAEVALKWIENLSSVLDARPVRLLLEL